MELTPTRATVAAALLLVVVGCGEPQGPIAAPAGFTAEIAGTVEGRVAGPGVLRYLPEAQTSFGTRPGYFFITDDTASRDLAVTLVVPVGTRPGTYRLVSARPMEVGTAFEARVDRVFADRVDSYGSDTSGMITLERFPATAESLAGAEVKGSFELSAVGPASGRITASGSFAFRAI